MNYSSMGNLKDKKEKFTSRTQLANRESISCGYFFNIMIDTRVNSDLAESLIVTFVLKIINSKSVSKTTVTSGGFIRVNVETDKNLSVLVCWRLDVSRRSSNQK